MTEIKIKKAYFGKSNLYDIVILYNATLKEKLWKKTDAKDTPTIENVFKLHYCLCWFATGLSTQ